MSKKPRKDDKPCEYCGEIVNHRNEHLWPHYQYECKQTVKKMVEGRDYVVCPVCNEWKKDLSKHLADKHGIPKDEYKVKYPDLKMKCSKTVVKGEITKQKRGTAINSPQTVAKTKKTSLERYGTDNPKMIPEAREKARKTMRRRHGVDYSYQSSKIYAKVMQKVGSYNRLEQFVDENTLEHLYCTGKPRPGYDDKPTPYFVHFRTPVTKTGRDYTSAYPDFILLSDENLQKVKDWLADPSQQGTTFDRFIRTKYVVELFGDHWHGQEITGVEREEHERQVLASYKEVGIECLILWESEVKDDWETCQEKLEEFIGRGLPHLNAEQEKVNQRRLEKEKAKIEAKLQKIAERDARRKEKEEERKADQLWRSQQPGYRARPTGLKYNIKTLYRKKDGKLCKNAGTWRKSWAPEEPPAESKQPASVWMQEYEQQKDPFFGKEEGKDFVVCTECGYKAKNLERHVNREHDPDTYVGPKHSESFKKTGSQAIKDAWSAGKRSHVKRVAYLGPDGKVWRQKTKYVEVWEREGRDPPEETVVTDPERLRELVVTES